VPAAVNSRDAVGSARCAAGAGFEVADADGRFGAATARRVDDAIVVSSAEVAAPRSVRDASAAARGSALRNGAGLPAAPCRAAPE